MAFSWYVPEKIGNPQTNFLRVGGIWEIRAKAEEAPESKRAGAVLLSGKPSSLEFQLPKPAVNELAGRDVPVPYSCGCMTLTGCSHRGDDYGFGLVTANHRGILPNERSATA